MGKEYKVQLLDSCQLFKFNYIFNYHFKCYKNIFKRDLFEDSSSSSPSFSSSLAVASLLREGFYHFKGDESLKLDNELWKTLFMGDFDYTLLSPFSKL